MKAPVTKSLRIFISSPGDVEDERKKAAKVIDYLQRWYGESVILNAVFWEDLPLSVDASFQEGIDIILNREPIDIAVFILWNRLGSPLGKTITNREGKPYRSGTEREFDMMLAAFEASGHRRPEILFYRRLDDSGFNDRLDARRHDDEELEHFLMQRKLARAFVEENFRNQEGHNTRAYHSFEKPVDFAQRLRVHLRALIDRRIESATPEYEARWTQAPYRGLETFDLEHADIFFGRDEEICRLETLLRRRERETDDPCAFVAVIGSSGSGKSSLVRAGLRASLTRNIFDDSVAAWRSIVMAPGQTEGLPLERLLDCIAATGVLPEFCAEGAARADLIEGFMENPRSATRLCLLPALRSAGGKAGGAVKLLLVVDQFEELFTDPRIGEQQRESFLRAVGAIARSGDCWVVVTLRSDFYQVVQKSPAFLDLKGDTGQFDILPPGPEALRRIIAEPARLAGVRFERRAADGLSLASRILEDAHNQPDLLPLLSDLLLELYLKRNSENEITFESYESMGGIEGALSNRAETFYNSLDAAQRALFPEFLYALITVEARSEAIPARRHAPLNSLRDSPGKAALVDSFIASRLLIAEGGSLFAVPTVSLAHEALIRAWPRVAEWVRVNRQYLGIRSRVEQFQERWQNTGRRNDLLLSEGLDLDEALSLLRNARHLMSADEYAPVREYIEVSVAFVKERSAIATAQQDQLRRVREAIEESGLSPAILHSIANNGLRPGQKSRRQSSSIISRAFDFLDGHLFKKRRQQQGDNDQIHVRGSGHEIHAAIMFTDIESFTNISQRVRDHERIVDTLNEYLEQATTRIFDHDGVIIKFIGDSIFAAWGVPIADELAPVKAARAAWHLFESVNLRIAGEELRTRVGLHFGKTIACNIGSTHHVEYSLMGEAVNLASRIDGLNRTLGTQILLSEAVNAQLGGEFITRRVGQFRIKGRSDLVMVYELLGPTPPDDVPPWIRTYQEALTAFESGDRTRARNLFIETDRSRIHGDGPSRFFVDHLARDVEAQAGIVNLKEK